MSRARLVVLGPPAMEAFARHLAFAGHTVTFLAAPGAAGGDLRADAVVAFGAATQAAALGAVTVLRAPVPAVDGLASLERQGGRWGGLEAVRDRLLADGVEATTEAIRLGAVEFRTVERVAASLQALRGVEAACDVVIADYVAERLTQHVVLTGFGMPAPPLLDHMARQVGERLGLPVVRSAALDHGRYAELVTAPPQRVRTPYDVAALRLPVEPDDSWVHWTRVVLTRIAAELAREGRTVAVDG